MSDFRHVYFGLHGVLIDSMQLRTQYPLQVARVLADAYGTQFDWLAAFQQVQTDWDSYYADLDLAGEDGIDHLWEGMFRTTRAIFRCAGAVEPAKEELTRLARSLAGRASAGCRANYPDVESTLAELRRRGMRLGVFASMSAGQVRGLLDGARIRRLFAPHTLLGLNTVGRFHQDADYWRIAAVKARVPVEDILVVDADETAVDAARSIGMGAVHISRSSDADNTGICLLTGLLQLNRIPHQAVPSRRTTP